MDKDSENQRDLKQPANRREGMFSTLLSLTSASVRALAVGCAALTIFLVVLTHTVGWAFDLTNIALRKGLGIATASAQATDDVKNLRAKVKVLEGDLDQSRTDLKIAREKLNATERMRQSQEMRLRVLNDDLDRSRTNLEKTRSKLSEAQSRIRLQETRVKQLNSNLDKSRAERFVVFKGKKMPVRMAANDTASSIRRRTVRTANANLAATLGESIPFYGIGVVVAATSFEIAMSCEDMKDLYELQVALDPESAVPEDRDKVCGLQVPTRQELWEKVKSSPSAAWDLATKALQTSGATLSELPKPDFSGTWQSVLSWFNGWFE